MKEVDFNAWVEWASRRNYDYVEWEENGRSVRYILNGKTESIVDLKNNEYFLRGDLI